tara:strand:- start:57 stop:683 length:627 start_codon:yes stop_codon:yes gene_type:complete
MKKVCIKCGVEQPLSEYSRHTAGKSGLKNSCKECERKRHRDWKIANADKINARRRYRTANDTEYREKTLEYKRKYKTIHRERYLELMREGANRRYRENPEFREKVKRRNRTDTKRRYNESRQQCIDKLGGKCVECGATESLQFDHINPLEKSFPISETLHWSPKKKKEVKFDEELDKCQLLCPKCHLEKTKNDWLSGELYKGIVEDRS